MTHLFLHLKLGKYYMWRIKHKMIDLLLCMLKSEMYIQVLQEINDNDLIRSEADDNDDMIEVTIPMENILPHEKDDNYIDDVESDAYFF